MASYQVTVTRGSDLWVAVIDGLPPHTAAAIDGEHLADLVADVPDVIADLTDVDPADIALHWRYEINGCDVTDALGRFLSIQRDLSERIAQRDEARMQAVKELTAAGLSRRTTGDAVELSGGRIQQLVG